MGAMTLDDWIKLAGFIMTCNGVFIFPMVKSYITIMTRLTAIETRLKMRSSD